MIKFSLTILVVAATALSFAQTDSSGTAFTLAQAQEYAVTNSYRAQQAKAQVLITIKKKKEIRAIGLPQVNGAVKFQNFLDIPTTLVPANAFNPLAPEGEFAELQFGTDYTTSAGVTASQILFDGSYLIGLKLADDYTGLYTQQEEKTLIQVKDDVARAYYAALVAFETRELLQATLVSMQHTLVELQQMNTQGFIEELAVDQQELQVSNLQNNISSIDRQIDMGLKLLKINMGLDIDEKITLTEDLETILASLNYEDLANQNFSVENNVDYRLLQTNQNIMKLSLQNEQFANLPSLSAFFNHTQNNMANDLNFETWYPTTLWGINASVPIFGSGSRMYKTQIAKIELEKSAMQLSEVEQFVKLEASSSKSELKNAYEMYSVSGKNVELAEKIYNTTLIKFKEGLATSTELAKSQEQNIEFQRLYIQSLFQLLNAKSKLDKAHNNY